MEKDAQSLGEKMTADKKSNPLSLVLVTFGLFPVKCNEEMRVLREL